MLWLQKNTRARVLSFSALTLGATGLAVPVYAYVVKRGDTLSQIAREQLGPPVYGQRGTLSRLKNLNPHIEDENHISIGQVIEVSPRSLALDQSWDGQPKASSIRSRQETWNGRGPAAEDSPVTMPPDDSTPLQTEDSTSQAEAPAPQTPSRFSEISLEPRFSYLRIDARDAATKSNAAFLSTLNVGARARWFQNWNTQWQSYIGAETMRVAMQNPTTRTLENGTHFYSGLMMGGNYRFFPEATVGVETGVREDIFNRAVNDTTLQLDPVAIPYLTASAAYDVYTSAPYTVGLSGAATFLSSASTAFYNVKVGSAYRAALHLHQIAVATNKPKLGVSLYFDYKTQNTSTIHLSQKTLGLDFVYFWGVAP